MRILAIADFHGKFPARLKKVVERLEFDVILSPGDYCSFLTRKLFFKHIYELKVRKELWDIIGKEKWLALKKREVKEGNDILRYLNNMGKPFFAVTGNLDRTGLFDIGSVRGKVWKWPKGFDHKTTLKFLKKSKIPVLDFAKAKFQGYDLIGYPRSSYPGIFLKSSYKGTDFDTDEDRKAMIEDYADHKKKMAKLFTNPDKTIFVSHNVPYRTKLDRVAATGHELARNKHYGSALTKELIKKYQPRLCIAGHMHENPGKIRIGKTVVINPGAAIDGRCALITLTEKQVKVRFIKA